MKKILFLFALVLLAQTGREVPRCKGEECRDEITKDLRDQPAWCQNSDDNGYAKNCSCKRSCDKNDRGSDCATYCRSKKCRCDHGCPMTR